MPWLLGPTFLFTFIWDRRIRLRWSGVSWCKWTLLVCEVLKFLDYCRLRLNGVFPHRSLAVMCMADSSAILSAMAVKFIPLGAERVHVG